MDISKWILCRHDGCTVWLDTDIWPWEVKEAIRSGDYVKGWRHQAGGGPREVWHKVVRRYEPLVRGENFVTAKKPHWVDSAMRLKAASEWFCLVTEP